MQGGEIEIERLQDVLRPALGHLCSIATSDNYSHCQVNSDSALDVVRRRM